jgi:ATP-binding cassette subfamily B protein/subfamily B ATP-binding cassette protein MsbA
MKLLVDSGTGTTPLPQELARILGWLGVNESPVVLVVLAAASSLLLFAISSILDAGISFTWTVAGQRMVYDLTADLLDRLQRLSVLFHHRRHVGDLLSRLSGDSWCAYTVADRLVIAPLHHLLTLAVISTIAWRLDPVLTVISLMVAPVLAATVVYFAPWLKQRASVKRQADAQLVSFVHQTLSSIPLVQAFSSRYRNTEQYREMADGAAALAEQSVVIENFYSSLLGLISAVGTAAVLCVGAQRVQSGALTVGGLLVFLAYLRTLQGASQGLLMIHGVLKTAEASIDRVAEIFDSDERIVESLRAVPLVGRVQEGLAIDFDDLCFGYDRALPPVLNNIEIHIEAGEVVALVGATGAGKSTIAALVPRLFDPWSGCVRIGGRDVRELTIESVRRHVAIVPQEPFLLPLTIEENIAYGRAGADRADVRRAAEAAGAAEFIERLPEGYQTVIGERGSTLSGGQRQRLSIARALLKDAPIIILDEPTSNLDATTEHEVMSSLERLMRGRTCLVIAHRLSTVRRANRIIVLDRGRIVQVGTHAQLLKVPGVYQRLCSMQHIGSNGISEGDQQ